VGYNLEDKYDDIRAGNYDREDRISSRFDHDLLIRLDTRMNELCKDLKDVAAEVRIINSRCNVQPKECQRNFVDKEMYEMRHITLNKHIDDYFERFRQEQQEERIKNRWFIGILVSIVNIVASVGIHILTK
jgi:hypothetical protein